MTRKAMVIDASALIAGIKGEPGAEAIRRIMSMPPEGGFFMHAINVCEVAYHLIKFGLIESIAYELATPEGVTIIDDIRPPLWKRAASLKARHKNLALGDCMAIALAESLDAGILTGDRDFQNAAAGIDVVVFR
ncbi:MAG: PIN domain-containing protein [Planctomycetota bacterium]|jgi:PIN domain nuclease of toxin-antitoxin system|nr:PIN domain-containing protein [Planctomycetota bacterium]